MVNQERIAIIIKVKLGREIMVNQERIAIIGVLFLILSFYVSLVIYSFFPEN
jgi:mannitol-specific phosphotransferase system IIBC component